jgi:hypothetical protein
MWYAQMRHEMTALVRRRPSSRETQTAFAARHGIFRTKFLTGRDAYKSSSKVTDLDVAIPLIRAVNANGQIEIVVDSEACTGRNSIRREADRVAHPKGTTLPFSCPFATTKAGNTRQRAAHGETENRPDFFSVDQRNNNSRQHAAKGGYDRLFRLLTGGLLVRVQPEEPIFSRTAIGSLTNSGQLDRKPDVVGCRCGNPPAKFFDKMRVVVVHWNELRVANVILIAGPLTTLERR